MKNGIKTLAIWLIAGVIIIAAISALVDKSDTRLKYSDLMTKIDMGEVSDILLSSDGTKAQVTLKGDSVKKDVYIPNDQTFMTYIQDQIKTSTFTFDQKPPSMVLSLFSLLWPFGFLIIFLVFWYFLMNQQQRRRQNNDIWKKQSKTDDTGR